MRATWTLGWFAATVALTTGCSRTLAPVGMASVSPSAATAEAMTLFDTNRDGKIGGEELRKCPGLKAALPTTDTNKDAAISADELSKRISAWQAAKVGRVAITCKVTLNGVALEGANVTFVPEKFLGAGIPIAKGVTDKSGTAVMASEGPDTLRGVSFGFYRVEISKQPGGRELLPAKYNTQTTLGIEVARDAKSAERATPFRLSTR